MARTVLHTQGAEGPGHGIGAGAVADEDVQRHKARPLGQEAAAADAVRQRAVAALQEGDSGRDGAQVGIGKITCASRLGGPCSLFNGVSLEDHRQIAVLQAFAR